MPVPPLWFYNKQSARFGAAGYAIFDGVDGWIRVPIALPTGVFSYEAEVKSLQQGTSLAVVGVASSISTAQYFTQNWTGQTTASNTRRSVDGTNNVNVSIPFGVEWIKIKVTILDDANFDVSVDGIVQEFRNETPISLGAGTDSATVGSLRASSPLSFWNGYIKNVKVSDSTGLLVDMPLTNGTAENSVGTDGIVSGGVTFFEG